MATINGRPAKYGISLKELRELMETRGREGIQRMQDFGGVEGVVTKLHSSTDRGLSGNRADIDHRREMFGSNVIPPKPPKTFMQLVCEAVQDITLIILIVAALVSLGLSFYKPDDDDRKLLHVLSMSLLLNPTFFAFSIQPPLPKKTNITDGSRVSLF